jgi:hypothetical protein
MDTGIFDTQDSEEKSSEKSDKSYGLSTIVASGFGIGFMSVSTAQLIDLQNNIYKKGL